MKKFCLILLSIVLITNSAKSDPYTYSTHSKMGDALNVSMQPFASLGLGVLSFYGDVLPKSHHWLSGMPAGKFTFSVGVGEESPFFAHLDLLYGVAKETMSEEPRQKIVTVNGIEQDLAKFYEGHLNFKSSIFMVGLRGEYMFPYFVSDKPGIRPYIGGGVSLLMFNSTSDQTESIGGVELPYSYEVNNIISYDGIYETKLGSGMTLAIPLDFGVSFQLFDAIRLRIGTSFMYTLSDEIDGVSKKTTITPKSDTPEDIAEATAATARLQKQLNGGNDFFAYTYISCVFFLPFL